MVIELGSEFADDDVRELMPHRYGVEVGRIVGGRTRVENYLRWLAAHRGSNGCRRCPVQGRFLPHDCWSRPLKIEFATSAAPQLKELVSKGLSFNRGFVLRVS